MDIHRLSVTDALTSLRSGLDGLTESEAASRLTQFGSNQVEAITTRNGARRLIAHFTHFFALVLWLAAGLAFFAEHEQPGQGMAMLGVAILCVIAINGLFSFWQEWRAERALSALQALLPSAVKVRRDGVARLVPASQLVPGDVILLAAGDSVPADCRLIESLSVRVNQSTFTGESEPVPRNTAPSNAGAHIQAQNLCFAGTTLLVGEAVAVVYATGMQTQFGQIARLTQGIKVTPSPLQQEITRLSHWLALLAVGMGLLFFLIGQSMGLDRWSGILFAIGIIVANIPEGLLPTVTLALAMAGQRMARRQVVIRHLPSVETLGCTSVIVSDKTGTLTTNQLVLTEVFVEGQWRAPTSLVGPLPLADVARHCHNLTPTGAGQWLGEPMDVALRHFAQQVEPSANSLELLDEIPFDSDRRRLSTMHRRGEGFVLYTKGAPESVLPCCSEETAAGQLRPLDESRRAALHDAAQRAAERGLRVLALAYRPLVAIDTQRELETELILAGLVAFADPPRPEVPPAIAQCRAAGIKVIMCTGDHPQTALAIAREIGLVDGEPVLLTGERMLNMTDAELTLALDAPQMIFARVSAEQKLRLVTVLKRRGEVVAVTGDGVNDAPALRHADIGVAMGIGGTAVAREAADMVLLDDNFASLVAAIEEGRAVYENIRKFLTYILTSNVPEIVPYLAFVLLRIPLPLTVIQILLVDLGTDMLPALALGAEPPEPGVMRQAPRPRSERLLTSGLLLRAYGFLGVIEAAAALATFYLVLQQTGWQWGQALPTTDLSYMQATTACLGTIIVMQVANVFLCRSRHRSLFGTRWAANSLLWLGVSCELSLFMVIAYTDWGHELFATADPPAWFWGAAALGAIVMVVLEEWRKWWIRRPGQSPA